MALSNPITIIIPIIRGTNSADRLTAPYSRANYSIYDIAVFGRFSFERIVIERAHHLLENLIQYSLARCSLN